MPGTEVCVLCMLLDFICKTPPNYKYIHIINTFFSCAGSSFLHTEFLSLQKEGATLVAVLRLLIAVASLMEHGLKAHGLSSCGRATGHVGSWNRSQTHVPCIGRWILNH